MQKAIVDTTRNCIFTLNLEQARRLARGVQIYFQSIVRNRKSMEFVHKKKQNFSIKAEQFYKFHNCISNSATSQKGYAHNSH